MKTIYVTVAEFLENGGILSGERIIYNEQYLALGTFMGQSFNNTTVVNRENGPRCVRKNDILFVAIQCTPIYK